MRFRKSVKGYAFIIKFIKLFKILYNIKNKNNNNWKMNNNFLFKAKALEKIFSHKEKFSIWKGECKEIQKSKRVTYFQAFAVKEQFMHACVTHIVVFLLVVSFHLLMFLLFFIRLLFLVLYWALTFIAQKGKRAVKLVVLYVESVKNEMFFVLCISMSIKNKHMHTHIQTHAWNVKVERDSKRAKWVPGKRNSCRQIKSKTKQNRDSKRILPHKL